MPIKFSAILTLINRLTLSSDTETSNFESEPDTQILQKKKTIYYCKSCQSGDAKDNVCLYKPRLVNRQTKSAKYG